MHLHDRANDTVCTQLPSPTGDELSFQQPPPILPEELIFDILLKLPVKSLLKLRCVCKSWKTLISDPKFAKIHLQNSTDEHKRLVSVSTIDPYKFLLSYPVKELFENPLTPVEPESFITNQKYRIVDSCNGLLCLYDYDRRFVRLFNPSMRLKSKRSPTLIGPHELISNYGFGYDQVNDKYKFIIASYDIRMVASASIYITKLYTFGEDSWKTMKNFPSYTRTNLGKFVSGKLNWEVDKGGVGCNSSFILNFDVEKETFGEVLLPQNDVHNMYKPMLYILRDCLCVFLWDYKTNWVIWLMKEYGFVESWTKLMIPREIITLDMRPTFVDPLFISDNGVVLIATMLEGSSNLFLYNLNSDGSDYDCPLIARKLGFFRHICCESLVSPCSGIQFRGMVVVLMRNRLLDCLTGSSVPITHQ